jgi:hypothetical protein
MTHCISCLVGEFYPSEYKGSECASDSLFTVNSQRPQLFFLCSDRKSILIQPLLKLLGFCSLLNTKHSTRPTHDMGEVEVIQQG